MVLTIITIWVGAITIGTAGARAAMANRWVRALTFNVVAGIFSIGLLAGLRGELAVALFRVGDIYVWLAMLSAVVMWAIMGAGAALAIWKRSRLTTT